jgi:hypothetical protein
MARTPIRLSVVLVVATLASSSRDSAQFSGDTIADAILAVQQYVRAGCVFILSPAAPGKSGATRTENTAYLASEALAHLLTAVSPHLVNI